MARPCARSWYRDVAMNAETTKILIVVFDALRPEFVRPDLAHTPEWIRRVVGDVLRPRPLGGHIAVRLCKQDRLR